MHGARIAATLLLVAAAVGGIGGFIGFKVKALLAEGALGRADVVRGWRPQTPEGKHYWRISRWCMAGFVVICIGYAVLSGLFWIEP